jgi:hypothetical protein
MSEVYLCQSIRVVISSAGRGHIQKPCSQLWTNQGKDTHGRLTNRMLSDVTPAVTSCSSVRSFRNGKQEVRIVLKPWQQPGASRPVFPTGPHKWKADSRLLFYISPFCGRQRFIAVLTESLVLSQTNPFRIL